MESEFGYDLNPDPSQGPVGPAPRVSRRTALGSLLAAVITPLAVPRAWSQGRGPAPLLGRTPYRPMMPPRQMGTRPLLVADGLARYQHTATPLLDGRVLLVGGFHLEPAARGNAFVPPLSSVQIYDPGPGVWYSVAPVQTPRARHAAVLLPDGRVLVLGGHSLAPLATVEIYDPGRDVWSYARPLSMPRYDHAVSLVGVQVIVTGGMHLDPLSSVETYTL